MPNDKNTMLLSIIIVSYNTKDLTLQTINSCLKEIANSSILKNKTEIIIVDNDSKDDSVAAINQLKKSSPKNLSAENIKIIKSAKNLGFGKANNLGLKEAKGELILFLNSDTVVTDNLEFSPLSHLVEIFLKHKDIVINDVEKLGILAASLLNQDMTPQKQGGSFPTLLSLFFHMTMLDDLPILNKILPTTQETGKNLKQTLTEEIEDDYYKIDWVGGTAMLTSKEVLDTIGDFDDSIFMYGEDIELCQRAAQHHYFSAIDPKSKIVHLQSKSSSSKNAIMGEFKGYLYLFAKHHSYAQAEIAKILLQIGVILRIFVFSYIEKNPQKVEIYKSVLQELDAEQEN